MLEKFKDYILIIDFGSQYTYLIKRRLRELRAYSKIVSPDNISKEEILSMHPKGIILSGGPESLYDKDSPKLDREIFNLNIPVLGICYGLQLIAYLLGGRIKKSKKREYGRSKIFIKESKLFKGIPEEINVWMSHGDSVDIPPDGFKVTSFSENGIIASIEKGHIFGLQFHPEVNHTDYGKEIIYNFLKISKCKREWDEEDIIKKKIEEIRKRVQKEKVIVGVSGGVDSAVTTLLLKKAIGGNLIPVFVDTGLLRKNEKEEIVKVFEDKLNMKLVVVDARKRFLNRLRETIDPEEKRKIIGEEFIRIFEEVGEKYKVRFLAQGTLYPDVIESGISNGPSRTIKSHHNVGGLPEIMKFKLIEPLRDLFKDEVRNLAEKLSIPEEILKRHPFPGPGLSIRIIGNVTEEKLNLLKEADHIFIEELKKEGFYHKVWQAFCVLLPVRSVGVMGDRRTYGYTIVLRAVNSKDGMTADSSPLPLSFLKRVASKIINEVNGINRVVYDLSSKPPSTIEWE